MEKFTYLIIGGGMAADAAVRGIRERDSSGRIGVLCKEEYPPYNRAPLTKDLWFGKSLEGIWLGTESHSISLMLGRAAVAINRKAQIVRDDVGNAYHYEKLLIATGSHMKQWEISDEGVIHLRTLKDYKKLRQLYDTGGDFLVVGASKTAREIAAAFAQNGKSITMLFDEPSLCAFFLPAGFSNFLNAYYTEKGVKLIPNDRAIRMDRVDGRIEVKTRSERVVKVDGVIVAMGSEPETELASQAGLKVENGIEVNRYLQSEDPLIYAAGEVANFFSPHLGKRVRIPQEDAASSLGRAAGRNMAGAREVFEYLPYTYSDMFEIGYEAIGEVDAHLEMFEVWQELYRQGVIYYMQDQKVRGALLVGVWDQVGPIRELIASNTPMSQDELQSRTTTH